MALNITPIRVQMTWEQIEYAAIIGVKRNLQDIREGRRHRWGARSADGWMNTIDGAIGEFALALHRKIPWDGALGNFKADDVGSFQVRATQWAWGHLLLHPEDEGHKPFVLATMTTLPVVWLIGWCFGFEGKQQQYWNELQPKRPCFVVPRTVLRDMSTLGSTAIPQVENKHGYSSGT